MRGIMLGMTLALVASSASAKSQLLLHQCGPTTPVDEAIANCTSLIRSGREPSADLVGEYFNRGLAYARKGINDWAIADFTQAIALTPNSAGAHFNRGLAYDREGLFDQAIDDYTQAIALKGDFAEARLNRGVDYDRKGRSDRAIADFTQAIALKPDFAGAYNDRAFALHKRGDDAQALTDVEKAAALAPNNGDIIETRAEIYEKLGRRDDAIADYRAALQIDPTMQLAKDRLTRMGVNLAPQDKSNPIKTFYPPEALAKGLAGEASLDCDEDKHYRPINCKFVSESPEGYGFAQAALRVAASIPANPKVTLEDRSKWISGPILFRFTPSPPTISPPPFEPSHIITNPDYLARPDGVYLAKKYPQLASGPPGQVKLECIVTVDGRLDACRIVEESPGGRGLGAAALDWASRQKMKPQTLDGVPRGGAHITTSLRFGRP